MYKLNSLTTMLIAVLLIGLIVFFPIMLIEALWNTTIAKAYTDFSINFWQALILWLIVLITLNILGLFKFEFAIEKIDSIENNPFKKTLEDVQSNTEKKLESTQNTIKEAKEKD